MKRILDILLSLFGIIILLPVFLILSVSIYLMDGRPIFFKQIRPGLKEKPFLLYKYKTMSNQKLKDGLELSDDKRITKLGSWLRKTSLDEIPSLLNVIKGDMSLVGPRPLLLEYLKIYNDQQKKRHNVKPGITGWAQINGRNNIDWKKKLDLDIWYVNNKSFWLDLKIIFKTFLKVAKQEDISPEGHAIMEKFKG